jgi:putative ABC transport system permease protein
MRVLRIWARSLRTLVRFPFRTLLIVMIAWLGVTVAVCSVNYALGGRQKLLDQFERLGTNIVIVTPQQSRTTGGRARTGSIVQTLVPADVRAIELAGLPILRSSPSFSRALLVKAGYLAKNSTPVIGVHSTYFEIKHWGVAQGQGFTTDEERGAAKVALLGSSVAKDLFGDFAIGNSISINRIRFAIVGVLAERGQGLDTANEDMQVYVPLSTAMRRLSNVEYFSSILFEVKSPDEMNTASEQIRAILHKRHPVVRKLPEDFAVQNQKELMDTQLAVSSRMLSYARWIAVCTLLISGFGALSLSWIAVRERTREIGTRRALGATRTDVFMQFLFESTVPAFLGCAFGIATVRLATPEISWLAGHPAVFDHNIERIAALAAICLNTIFGLLPAKRASELEPVDALRFE